MLWTFVLLISIGLSHGICPPAELIAPLCTCRDFTDAMMTCNNVFNADDLMAPISSLAPRKYRIFSLEIRNSSLLYLPHNLFKGVSIEKIRFLDSQIMSLSDTDVAFEGLEDSLSELRATDAHYVAQWDWQQLRHLRKLTLIDVNWINMGSVSQPLPKLKHLNALGIIRAGITHIVDYAFAELSGLRILNLKQNEIRDLKRTIFPLPALELSFLDLSHNELEVLPKDFFRSMPNLVHLSLSHNKFVTIPVDTFKSPMKNLEAFLMIGNKINCDCKIRWLIGSRLPYEFEVYCAQPQSLAGRKLLSVEFKEFQC